MTIEIVPRRSRAAARSREAEPEPEITGDTIFTQTSERYISAHAALAPQASDLLALWAGHTHLRTPDGVLATAASMRLWVLSSKPKSGKTTVLDMLNLMCPYTFGLDTEPTAPGLKKTITSEHATVLIDEGDILFGAGGRHEAVRAVINAGYTPSGNILTAAGRAPVFGPLAMAGLDTLATGTGDKLAALLSRGVVVRMEQARPETKWTQNTVVQGHAVRAAMAWWVGQNQAAILAATPRMPEWMDGRTEQIWTAPYQIAEVLGGDWPERAQEAAETLSGTTPTAGTIASDFLTALAN